VKQNEWHKQV